MTPADARTAVDVIAHTLARIADERSLIHTRDLTSAARASQRIEEALYAVGREVESIVAAGHAAELAGLGEAVARWRR